MRGNCYHYFDALGFNQLFWLLHETLLIRKAAATSPATMQPFLIRIIQAHDGLHSQSF